MIDGRNNPTDILNRVRSRLYDTTRPENAGLLYSNTNHIQDYDYTSDSGSPIQRADWMKKQNNTDTWYGKAWDYITDIPSRVHNTVTEDFPNTLRTIAKKLAEGKVNNDVADIQRFREERDAANKILDYYNLVHLAETISGEISLLLQEDKNNPRIRYQIEKYSQQLNDVYNKLQDLDTFFKTDGRNYDIVREQMYNKSGNFLDNFSKSLSNNTFSLEGSGEWYDVFGNLVKVGKNAAKLGINVLHGAGNLIDILGNSLSDGDYLDSEYIRLADQSDPEIERRYRGFGNNGFEKISLLAAKLYSDAAKKSMDEAISAYEEDVDFYTNGKLRPLSWYRGLNAWLGINPAKAGWNPAIKVYDPEDINPLFEKEQLEHAGEFWHPLYSVAEIGSTLSLIDGLVGSIAVDKGAQFLSRKLPGWVLNNTAGKGAKLLRAGVLVADAAANMGLTMYSRILETGQEAEDAITSRISDEASKRNIDLTDVLLNIKSYADTMGINTEGLNDNQLIGLGLALGVPLENEDYNKIAENSKKGLLKLINANNSLAYSDYLQTLPFMSYSGSIAKFFGRGNNIGRNILSRFGSAENRATANALGNIPNDIYGSLSYIDNWVNQKLEGFFGNVVNKAAAKLVAKDAPKAALRLKHTQELIGKYTKPVLESMLIEGVEEGVLHLLQQRYQRGDYDEYKNSYSVFNIPEVFRDLKMSAEAIGNFTGLNFGDPDNNSSELRKAMLIGALLGPVFHGVGAVTSNVIPGENAHIRNWISQIKADGAINQLIGDSYGAKQDEDHLNIFYDALQRSVKVGALRKSLNDFSKFVDINNPNGISESRVTSDYINRDVLHLNNLYTIYTNEKLQNIIRDLDGITPENKKALTISGAIALTDFQQALAENSELEYNHTNERRYILKAINSIAAGENVENHPELKRMYDFYSQLYDLHKEKLRKNTDLTLKKYNEKIDTESIEELLEDDFVNEVYHEMDIDLRDNKNELKQAVLNKIQSFSSRKGFIGRMAMLNFDEKVLKRIVSLSNQHQDSHKINDFIKNNLGVDIDIDRILGTIDTLNQIGQEYLRKIQQGSIDVAKRIGQNVYEIALLFEGYEFDNQDELNKIADRYIISSALLPNLQQKASVYLYGEVDPTNIANAIYGEGDINNDGTITPMSAERLGFVTLMDEDDELFSELSNKPDIKEIIRKKQNIDKRAAITFLDYELQRLEKRSAIAHRKYMDDIAESPDIVDNIENGDLAAEDALKDKISGEDNNQNDGVFVEDVPLENNDDRRTTVKNRSAARDAIAKALGEPTSDKLQRRTLELKERTEQSDTENQAESEESDEKDVSENPLTDTDRDLNFKGQVVYFERIKESVEDEYRRFHDLCDIINSKQDGDVLFSWLDDDDIEHCVACDIEKNDQDLVIKVGFSGYVKKGDKWMPEESSFYFNIPEEYIPIKGDIENGIYNVEIDPNNKNTLVVNNGTAAIQHINNQNVSGVVNKESDEKDVSENQAESEYQAESEESDEEPEDILTPSSEKNDYDYNPVSEDYDADAVPELDYNMNVVPEEPDEDYDINSTPDEDYDITELPYDYIYDALNSVDFDPNDQRIHSYAKNQENVNNSDVVKSKFIRNTFFYKPDETNTILLKIGKDKVKFKEGFVLKPGKELAKKLSEKNWIDSEGVDKYFIVTSPFESGLNEQDPNNFTVCLIIEDSNTKSVYATALRTSKRAYDDLLKIGIESETDIDEEFNRVHQEFILNEYRTAKNTRGIPRETKARAKYISEAMNWYYTLLDTDFGLKVKIDDDTRKTVFGASVKSIKDEIIPEITALQEFRNSIIEACLGKPVNGRYIFIKDQATRESRVRPQDVSLSNGAFIKTDTYNKLNISGNQFGFGNTVESIQEALDSEKVSVGVGRGLFGTNPWNIENVYTEQQLCPGRGYAGKIYLGIEGLAGITVPLMLWELRFNVLRRKNGTLFFLKRKTSNNPNGNLIMAIDPVTGMVDNSVDVNPSAAEIILYLITNKLHDSYLPGSDPAVKDALKNVIIRQVSYTKNNAEFRIPHYAEKQILWIFDKRTRRNLLKIYMDGSMKTFSELELFGIDSEETRRRVIYQIASKMHWNTDLKDKSITESFNDNYPELSERLKIWFLQNKGAKSFSILGLPEFTFAKEDLFDEKMNAKKTSILAWMIKNGKLVTNVDPKTILGKPFVYASGIKESPTIKTKRLIEESPNIVVEQHEDGISEIKNKTVRRLRDSGVVSPKEDVEDILNQMNETPAAKKYGNCKAILLLDINPKNAKEEIREKLEKRYPGADIINIPNQIFKNDVVSAYVFEKDGKYTCTLVKDAGQIKRKITEIYSKARLHGKIDAIKTKRWIAETLGISSENIHIVNAIYTAVSDEKAYGAMRVSTDNILRNIFPAMFELSSNAGRGIGYHESWHYVNLLLHSESERNAMYDEYRNRFFWRKNYSNEAIEEMLAEDFRRFVEHRIENNFTNKFARSVVRILEFLGLSRKESQIRLVYNAILSGKYAAKKISDASLQQFLKNYSGAVYSLDYYPGVDKSLLFEKKEKTNKAGEKKIVYDRKLKSIDNPELYNNICRSIVNGILSYFNLNTIAKVRQQKDTFFKEYIEELKRELDVLIDVQKLAYLQEVINYPEVFEPTVMRMFEEYGLRPNLRIEEKNIQRQLSKELLQDEKESSEDDSLENVWDKEGIEISKKSNVTFDTKLFLSSVPKLIPQEQEDGSITYITEEDDLLGSPVYFDFDEAWHYVINDLWKCDSFREYVFDESGKKVLSPTSMLYKIERLAKAGSIFYISLKNQIDNLFDDAESITKMTKFFTSLASNKTKVGIISVKKAQLQSYFDDYTYGFQEEKKSEEDINKKLNILGDNTINTESSILKTWGLLLVSGPLVGYTELEMLVNKGGLQELSKEKVSVPVVNKTLAENINKISKIAKKAILDLEDVVEKNKHKINKRTENNEVLELIEDAKSKVVDLLLAINIPYDKQILDVYLENFRNKKTDNALLKETDAIVLAFSKSSTIFKIIKYILSYEFDKKTPTGKLVKDLSEIFNFKNYRKDMHKMARAYLMINPSSKENSLIDPSGTRIFAYNDNSQLTDTLRDLSNNKDGVIQNLIKSPYSSNSRYLRWFLEGNTIEILTHRGIKDLDSNDGQGYILMSDIEDYICKLKYTFGNFEKKSKEDRKKELDNDDSKREVPIGYFLTPTMADKKGFYGFKFINKKTGKSSINTFHDTIYAKNGRFSDQTLDIFYGYFMDELNALIQYYDKNNIEMLEKNPKKLRKNYHGKLKNGKMQFGGNGGYFRYFYDIVHYKLDTKEGEEEKFINANEFIQVLYQRGGFLAIYDELINLKSLYDISGKGYNDCINSINQWLIDGVNGELKNLANSSTKQIITESEGSYKNLAIPKEILNSYLKLFIQDGKKYAKKIDYLFSTIANHYATTIMSVIEFEKTVFADPAYFKYFNFNELKSVKINGKTYKIDVIKEKHSDKIKRLGSVLSPGKNLRNDFTIKERKELGIRKSNLYTVLNVADFKSKSRYVDNLAKPNFKKQFLVNKIIVDAENVLLQYAGDYRVTEVIQDIYNPENKIDDLYKKYKISEDIIKEINDQSEKSASPYDDINVSDAEVLIRPSLYRELRIRLGSWLFEETKIQYKDDDGKIKYTTYSDEIAYNILEKDASWMNSMEQTAIVSRFEAQALKMTYFLNNSEEVFDNVFLNIPIYNKMAIFPIFKWAASSETGNLLYSRMNLKDNEIDMIVFESAVKVGLPQQIYSPYDGSNSDHMSLNGDINNLSSLYLDTNGNIKLHQDKNTLNVTILSLKNLRLLLNTESHKSQVRNYGSQALKLSYSNIFENLLYESTDYLKEINGKDLKDRFFKILNAIIEYNGRLLYNRFRNLKSKKQFIKSVIKSNGLDLNIFDIINHNGTISGTLSRSLFELSLIATLNSTIIDFETLGGTAIQLSIFGFLGDKSKTALLSKYPNLNNGQPLKWNKENNSLEIMLSIKFFKDVIPEEELTTFENMRRWLIEHDFINGVKENGEQSNPKPFGIGYRVPTQGQSSMFSFCVADVLPETSGDLVVVPEEFTSQTGSDFDVDKVYLATLYHTNGSLDILTDEQRSVLFNGDLSGSVDNIVSLLINKESGVSLRKIKNEFILMLMQVLQSAITYGGNRASIDTISSFIKNDLLPAIKKQTFGYPYGGNELSPYFQSERKREFTAGKEGVAIFALAITNLAQTLGTGLNIVLPKYMSFLKPIDTIVSKDATYVSDWLSAMLNAHVDVAKDSYIFDLNINKFTYDVLTFLFRSGMGAGTLSYIAQPILKEYANRLMSISTIYGKNLNKQVKLSKAKQEKYYALQLIDKYTKKLKELGISEKDRRTLVVLQDITRLKKGEESPYEELFDYEKGKGYLENPESKEAILFQIKALTFFTKLNYSGGPVDLLSNLVQLSRIDTKKSGNTLAKLENFKNKFDSFVYNDANRSKFIIKNMPNVNNPLEYYFDITGLKREFDYIYNISNIALRGQSVTATNLFKEVFNTISVEQNGKTGSIPNPFLTEKEVEIITKKIEDVIRYYALSKYGKYFDKYNEGNTTQPYVQYVDGSEDSRDRMIRLLYHDQDHNNLYENNTIFENIQILKDEVLKKSWFSKERDEKGGIKNPFLKILYPINTTKNGKIIGRIEFLESPMDMSADKKSKIVSGFYDMLTHSDNKFRRLAKDLAFYFYYNGYDTSSRNSGFGLVPYIARLLYDGAISKFLLEKSIEGNITPVGIVEDIIDVVYRNSWQDDTMIPVLDISGASNSENQSIDDLKSISIGYNKKYTDKIGGKIPGLIYSKYNSNMFVKIQRSGSSFVYKKYATIIKTEGKSKTTINVYRIFPKAGTNVGNLYSVEYDILNLMPSSYKENDLHTIFAPGVFDPLVEITKYIKSSKDSSIQYKVDFKFISEAVQINYSDLRNTDVSLLSGYISNGDPNVLLIPVWFGKGYQSYHGQKLRNVRRVEFGADETDTKFWHSLSFKNDKNLTVKDVVDGMSVMEGRNITLYFSGNLDYIKATPEEIDLYKLQLLQRTNSIDGLLLSKESLDKYKTKLDNYASEFASQIKRELFIYEILEELDRRGVNVIGLYTSRGQAVAEITARAGLHMIETVPNYFLNSGTQIPIGVYIDEQFYKKLKDDYNYYKDDEFRTDYYDVHSDEELDMQDRLNELTSAVETIMDGEHDKINDALMSDSETTQESAEDDDNRESTYSDLC